MYTEINELFTILPIFVPTIAAASGPEGTHKNTRISESMRTIKIGRFVSFSKWPGELGSVDCVIIARSPPFVRLIPRGHFCMLDISHGS